MNAKDSLIVAADFKPEADGVKGVEAKVLKLAKDLQGLECYIKVNSILRATGYGLITRLHDLGLRVMADLKLTDISETMATDAVMLAEFVPEILTVMANSSVAGMVAVKQNSHPITEIFGVTVLTSFDDEECDGVYGCSTKAGVVRLARLAQLAYLDGLVLSTKEIGVIIKRPELLLSKNTPGIRPLWSFVENDDQERTGTPGEAIKNGSNRLIIGRPIVRAKNPREAAMKTLLEIQDALDDMEIK